jgi:hypothetical protein
MLRNRVNAMFRCGLVMVGQMLALITLPIMQAGGSAGQNGYVRLLPNEGGNVYPATGLFRQWPTNGPKEL